MFLTPLVYCLVHSLAGILGQRTYDFTFRTYRSSLEPFDSESWESSIPVSILRWRTQCRMSNDAKSSSVAYRFNKVLKMAEDNAEHYSCGFLLAAGK